MNLIVRSGNPLSGEIRIPGDKSISHRAALFAALAEGQSRIEHFLVSGVTERMLRALTALGVSWQLTGDSLAVSGGGLHGLVQPVDVVDCGNSATTLRLLAGALAASGLPAVLDGSPGLRKRPMGRIVEPLQAMGAAIQAAPSGGAPLTLAGRPQIQKLLAAAYSLPIASAQVKSCLLLAALAADGPVTLTEPSLSRDHSERMLRAMGVNIETFTAGDGKPGLTITPPPGGTRLAPLCLTLPGDFSAAAFLMVAGLITPGSDLLLRGVGLNPTRTGLLAVLQEMGADVQVLNLRDVSGEPVGDLRVRSSSLHGGQVSGARVVEMIDEFPVFAVAAAFARGRTQVRQAGELRYKESDRIHAVCQGLGALGVQAEEKPDGFDIFGADGAVRGGARLDPQGDHRLAMALAVAGLAADQPVVIENAGILAESFPEFPAVLRSLGAIAAETGGEG